MSFYIAIRVLNKRCESFTEAVLLYRCRTDSSVETIQKLQKSNPGEQGYL